MWQVGQPHKDFPEGQGVVTLHASQLPPGVARQHVGQCPLGSSGRKERAALAGLSVGGAAL